MPKGGEVGGCVFGSDAAFVIPEGHIHHPVEAVFHGPVTADDGADLAGRQSEGCDEEAGLSLDLFVASGHDPRVDIVPAELLRGPIDAHWFTSGTGGIPWPHLDFDLRTEGRPAHLAIERNGGKNDRLYVVLPDALPVPKVAVFDLSISALAPTRVGDLLPSATKARGL